MCHTGTSNGGKKWRMVLFQVDSFFKDSLRQSPPNVLGNFLEREHEVSDTDY